MDDMDRLGWWIRVLRLEATVLLSLTLAAAGCSVAGGGFRFCLLDHADLTLATHHEHEDPNGVRD